MTVIELPELIQGTDEWHDQRRGIVTASVVGRLITPATIKPASNPESRSLTAQLAAERITGWTDPTYMNDDMLRGVEDDNVEAIVKGDLADIKASDAVIAYCPRPAWGTAMEIHRVATVDRYVSARTWSGDYVQLGLRKVVAVVPAGVPVSPWLRYHSDAVVETLEDAVDTIRGWL